MYLITSYSLQNLFTDFVKVETLPAVDKEFIPNSRSYLQTILVD
jgi:hypothetical protein